MGERDSLVLGKSYEFAVGIVETMRLIQLKHGEYVLTKQLMKAGISIGARVAEGHAAQTVDDFLGQMAIALKEARETRYWLRLVRDTKLLDAEYANRLIEQDEEIIRFLSALVNNAKKNG